jgi:hypothetical protein
VRRLGRLLFRTVVVLAGVYLIFLLFWGSTTGRLPLTAKLDDDPRACTPAAARALAARTIPLLNEDGRAAALRRRGRRTALGAPTRADVPPGRARARRPARHRAGFPKTSLGRRLPRRLGNGGLHQPRDARGRPSTGPPRLARSRSCSRTSGGTSRASRTSRGELRRLLACARSTVPQIRYAAGSHSTSTCRGWRWRSAAARASCPRRTPAAPRVRSAPATLPLPALSPLVRADLRAMPSALRGAAVPGISRVSSPGLRQIPEGEPRPRGNRELRPPRAAVLGVRFRGAVGSRRAVPVAASAARRPRTLTPRRAACRWSWIETMTQARSDRDGCPRGSRTEEILHAEASDEPRARLVAAEGAEHAARRARNRRRRPVLSGPPRTRKLPREPPSGCAPSAGASAVRAGVFGADRSTSSTSAPA